MIKNIDRSGLVTIAIPTYNRVQFLEAAINSAIAQTYANIEIIISDNASEDGTSRIIASAMRMDKRVRSLTQTQNLGMRGNWNACLNAANGKFFLLLSDDDFLTPGAVELLVQKLIDQEVRVAYGRAEYFGNKSGTAALDAPELEAGSLLVHNLIHGKRHVLPSVTMFRTADALCCGGYPDTGTATDLALLLLLLRNDGKIACVDKPIGNYRVHGASLSASDESAKAYVHLFDWLEIEDRLPQNWVNGLQKMCQRNLNRWVWLSALNNNDRSASVAVELLRNMPGGRKYQLLLLFRRFPFVKFLAVTYRKWIKSRSSR